MWYRQLTRAHVTRKYTRIAATSRIVAGRSAAHRSDTDNEMNAQTAPQPNVAQPITLGSYRLYHRADGTFWVAFAQNQTEVPLMGSSSSLPPIRLVTAQEHHALFVRNCSVQQAEAVLWDERLIDGVPVRWEILLREEPAGDLRVQVHFLSYGSVQASVQFLYNISAEKLTVRTFSSPHPSGLIITPLHSISVVTLHPTSPTVLHQEVGDRFVWTLPTNNLHQQSLQLLIHVERYADRKVVAVNHVEHSVSLFAPEPAPLASMQLRTAVRNAVALLLNPSQHAHFAEDQIVLRVAPDDARFSAFTLAAAKALYDWNRFSGEESAVWTARLAMNSAMEFQVLNAQSSNSGACWDTVNESKQGSDITGQRRFNLYRNARLLQHLLLLHRDTGSELSVRVALNGISWLLLKRGARGNYDGACVLPDGTVHGGSARGVMGAIVSVMCAAYSLTETEAYMHAANRLADFLLQDCCEPLEPGKALPDEPFPDLHHDVFAAASAIEGLARLYRAYPHDNLKAGAVQIMHWLRLWQLEGDIEPMGGAGEVLAGEVSTGGYVDASTEAARGALWALSLEQDVRWFAYATRALHAAARYLDPMGGFPTARLAYPDHVHALAMFVRAYLHWLLSIATLAPGVDCDPDLLVCRYGNRIFVPEPSLWQKVRVQARGLTDWVALVCPATHDILLVLLTDGGTGVVLVDAGEHRHMALDLMSGETAPVFPLHAVPGVGGVGVYILQA